MVSKRLTSAFKSRFSDVLRFVTKPIQHPSGWWLFEVYYPGFAITAKCNFPPEQDPSLSAQDFAKALFRRGPSPKHTIVTGEFPAPLGV